MRRLLAGILFVFVLACCTAVPNALAQLPKLKINFVVPQGADPPIVINFTQFNVPVTVSGADILDSGVELHGLIPGSLPGYLTDITQIEVLFTLNAPVNVAFGGTGGWQNWSLTIESGKPDYDLVFETPGTVGVSGGNAPINENFDPMNGQSHSFATINATTTDPTIEAAFRAATVTITPFTVPGAVERPSDVPEPGIAALTAALLTLGTVPILRSRKRRA